LGSYIPYVTAGGAWAYITENYVDGFTSLQVENSRSQQGWTAGAGVDARVSDDISMRVEYRHSDYGSTPEDSWYKLHVTDETLRLGINYNFR
jgi:outer membrane immunogenic protein